MKLIPQRRLTPIITDLAEEAKGNNTIAIPNDGRQGWDVYECSVTGIGNYFIHNPRVTKEKTTQEVGHLIEHAGLPINADTRGRQEQAKQTIKYRQIHMTGFIIKTKDNQTIRFRYYNDDAPISVAAFDQVLPFTLSFYHARTSGQEFWLANAFPFDIIQENASVFTEPGEIVLGPLKPARAKAGGGGIGVYYGEGKGLDAANIFGRAFEEDLPTLKALGEKIWKQGQQELTFEKLDQAT